MGLVGQRLLKLSIGFVISVSCVKSADASTAAPAQALRPSLELEDFASIMSRYKTLHDVVADLEDLGPLTHEEALSISQMLGSTAQAALPRTHAENQTLLSGPYRFTWLPDGSIKTQTGRVIRFNGSLAADAEFRVIASALNEKSSALSVFIPRAEASDVSSVAVSAASLTLTAFRRLAQSAKRFSCAAFDSVGLSMGKLYAWQLMSFEHTVPACSRDGRFILHDREKAYARAVADYDRVQQTTGACARTSEAWKLWRDTLVHKINSDGDLEISPKVVEAYFAPGKVQACTENNLADIRFILRSRASTLRAKLKELHRSDSVNGEWEERMKKAHKEIR